MLSFDVFIDAFLYKVSSYDYLEMDENSFNEQMDTYLLATCADFDRIFRSRTRLTFADRDVVLRQFNWDFPDYETQMTWNKHNQDYISLDQVVDIVSQGMVVRWMSGFLFSGDGLDFGSLLQTRDFTVYSPSSFLSNLRTIYEISQNKYRKMVNEFSYNHANLLTLHM